MSPHKRPTRAISMLTSSMRGIDGAKWMMDLIVTAASSSPKAPPASPSSVFSVRSWRTSRARPAPMAARIASSRRRDADRDSSRFATFADAISSTKPTAPNSAPRVNRTFATCRSKSGTMLTPVSVR